MTDAMNSSVQTNGLRIHQYAALEPGVRLIVLGAVHGNEVCGTRAIERLISELDQQTVCLLRGHLTLVPITNPLAYQRNQRGADRNLNRNLRLPVQPQDYEDRIANVLCPLLDQHDVLLDLHSFHTGGKPFAMIGPSNNQGTLEPFSLDFEEERWALRLGPRRLVEGWLDAYALGVKNRLARVGEGANALTERAQLLNTDPSYGVGTTEYMRSRGGYAITLECGQHVDPQAPEVAYQALRNTLAHLGMLDEPSPPACESVEFLRLVQVTDRLHAQDAFSQPWQSFDPVKHGQKIGTRLGGAVVTAPSDGYIVFPNPAALPGNEWFYFAQQSPRCLRAD
jgi:uncharacterized protein